MSQKQDLLDMFRIRGGRLFLGEIMKTELAAEYRARFSELRQDGYIITCKKGATPSENLYCLVAEPGQTQPRLGL